jgi:hypothetical protein
MRIFVRRAATVAFAYEALRPSYRLFGRVLSVVLVLQTGIAFGSVTAVWWSATSLSERIASLAGRFTGPFWFRMLRRSIPGCLPIAVDVRLVGKCERWELRVHADWWHRRLHHLCV